jgi:hypothetical protein
LRNAREIIARLVAGAPDNEKLTRYLSVLDRQIGEATSQQPQRN